MPPDLALWWTDANAVALRPTRSGVDGLRSRLSPEAEPQSDHDERERQVEMIEGLDHLCDVAESPALPVLDTQHA